ncbi:hypothetical protein L5515_013563 [Caenorhabditis briggsae]|uniref:HECT-type E3 ubiquitin transferase n=1 Tax=Caenorhabditis briggsae TaxID=6238 RepID=A0AAE9J768_CAEBR|nr:hypothetical protein L5515_013563 [Caenorhabditis briggsae]
MSFNLVFFNGDVRRDKKQEAMLNSMNARGNFLQSLADMEKQRTKNEEQTKAVRKIQKKWRGFRARHFLRLQFRAQFDAISDGHRGLEKILHMAQLLVNFYETNKDEERLVMTLVELVKARTANRAFEQQIRDSQRFLLARCCVKFLDHADENTIFFHVFRFLEDFVTCHSHLYEAISQHGLFDAEFHLLEALIGKPEDVSIQKKPILPRHLQLLTRIFDVFVLQNPARTTPVSVHVADRLLKTICVKISDLNFANYILYYIRDHIRLSGTQHVNPNSSVIYEAGKSANVIQKWKLRPEEVETASIRLRAVFLSFVENVNKTNSESLKQLFDSLALVLDQHATIMKTLNVKEDLTENGRLRTAVNQYIWEYSNGILSSVNFRRAACAYANTQNVNVTSLIPMRKHFTECMDLLASSDTFLEALYTFITSSERFEPDDCCTQRINALELFCNCLNKRISSVADSDFIPTSIFPHFDATVEFVRDVSIKLIHSMFPVYQRGEPGVVRNQFKDVTDAVFSFLGAIYQKDIRLKYFPEGFWTNHGREVFVGIGHQARTTPRNRRQQPMRSEFVERLAELYEEEGGDSDDEELMERNAREKVPTALQRGICIMKNIPFIVPFMDRVQLFNRLVSQEHDRFMDVSRMFNNYNTNLTVRRDQIYMDAFEKYKPKAVKDDVRELKANIRVKMINWAGSNEQGVDGGGIFREFLSELLKDAFSVNRGFFTETTESKLLYPNPTAIYLLGADCLTHYQFIGRMIGKLIYERQLQEVRFAEFFIAQLFEDRTKDVDLQHMKSFDPLIFKNLKALQTTSEQELDELQLDFSVVTSDVGLVRTVNLKPNGSNQRVTVDNVHEYIRLYVNYYLKQRIATMVGAIRRGISEVVNIEWMSMFAPHELQILIAGFEEVFTIKELQQNCQITFGMASSTTDQDFIEMIWDVIDKLSKDDKMAFLRFVTGCSRAPVDGLKSLYPKMGILVISTSEEELPTSATCMNLLRIPKYSNRTKLEEKLRYAINSGAGFELA